MANRGPIEHRITTKGATVRRACLRCDRVFDSVGPHNRVCKPCKQVMDAGPTPETVHTVDLHAKR